MNSFPTELISKVYHYISTSPSDPYLKDITKDVQNLRLVSKRLAYAGAPFLFRRIRILPSTCSAQQIEYILTKSVYTASVKEIIFCFEEEPENQASKPLRFRIPPATQSVMSRISSSFRNVHSIKILLPAKGSVYGKPDVEWNRYRGYILASISKNLSPPEAFPSLRTLLIDPVPGYMPRLPLPSLPDLENLYLPTISITQDISDPEYWNMINNYSTGWEDRMNISTFSLGEIFLSLYPTIKTLMIGSTLEGQLFPLGRKPTVTFGSIFLKHLRELRIRYWTLGLSPREILRTGLVEFLLRHKEVLEVLSIDAIYIIVDHQGAETIRFSQVFEILRGELQKLRQLKIGNWWYDSCNDDSDSESGFGVAEHESSEVFEEKEYHEADREAYQRWEDAVKGRNKGAGHC